MSEHWIEVNGELVKVTEFSMKAKVDMRYQSSLKVYPKHAKDKQEYENLKKFLVAQGLISKTYSRGPVEMEVLFRVESGDKDE